MKKFTSGEKREVVNHNIEIAEKILLAAETANHGHLVHDIVSAMYRLKTLLQKHKKNRLKFESDDFMRLCKTAQGIGYKLYRVEKNIL